MQTMFIFLTVTAHYKQGALALGALIAFSQTNHICSGSTDPMSMLFAH